MWAAAPRSGNQSAGMLVAEAAQWRGPRSFEVLGCQQQKQPTARGVLFQSIGLLAAGSGTFCLCLASLEDQANLEAAEQDIVPDPLHDNPRSGFSSKESKILQPP
ncbi:hypothetical protein DUI87_03812 [Hirundo rustica rustica]|uniref:Uncharacterized protein n=1 Tax=Hirundo rustica rustica TaxID=333673 RepID=A0A3M0LJE5_HIRRU|nr:hypothetical protein DUI87_03812 [Hirundo rustica rustica]